MRYFLARLRDVLGMRGNDGLTRKERAELAAAYRAKVMGPISDAEMDAFAAWRERRL